MTPALLVPAALAALAALALPLILHVARRSEQRVTDFAALRWLVERPRPRRRLRFDEKVLLALRLLLVALVALWLARPVLLGAADRTPWLAVMPGVDPGVARAAGRVRARWLAPGFPPLDRPAPEGAPAFASLLRALDATLPPGTPLRVVVPTVLQGADGERPRLSRHVDWQVVSGAMPPARSRATRAPAVAVRAARETAGLGFVRAALLSSGGADVADTDAPLPPTEARLVWLAPGPLPARVRDWVAVGGTALVTYEAETDAAWRDEGGALPIEEAPLGKGRLLRFAAALTPAAMPALVEPDFPARLRALLAPPSTSPARVAARDYAPLPGGPAPERPARALRPPLAILIALLLLVERWVATRRARGVAP